MNGLKICAHSRVALSGVAYVEFVLVVPIILLLLIAITQFAFILKNQVQLSEAAISGAHLLSAKRGMTCPVTRTGCGKKGARDLIREMLDGKVASAATLNTALTINMGIRTPYEDADACGDECTGGTCEDNICVIPCSNNSACATALGTLDQPPPLGTLVQVELIYVFAPFVNAFGLENLNRIRVITSEPVQ